MRQSGRLNPRRTALVAVGIVCAASVVLLFLLHKDDTPAAYRGDIHDPIAVSRDFLVATWTGDTAVVEALTCRGVVWSLTGDPTLTVDADHLVLAVEARTEQQAVVVIGGVVTFKSASGQIEVRNLDELGQTRLTLENDDGWKICNVQ